LQHERNNLIDFIKSICILGVMCIHTVGLSFSVENISVLGLYIDHLFRFAVPIFIGILGYMTIRRYINIESWSLFYKKKILYIVIPFYIWSFIYYLTPNAYPFSNGEEGKQYWWQILNGESEIQLYFMIAYFLFLLMTPLVIFLYKKLSRSAFIIICLLLLLGHVSLLIYSDYMVWIKKWIFWYTNLNYSLPIHWLAYYLIGILMAIFEKQISHFIISSKKYFTKSARLVISLFLYLLVVMAFLVSMRGLKPYATVYLVLLCLVALYFLYNLYDILKVKKVVGYFYFIGNNTFPIYLSHVLFIKVGFFLLEKHVSFINLFIIYVGCLIFSVLYTLLHKRIYKLIKINPSKDLAQDIEVRD
jgi:surface polysaccharide O-acyltransferase-like enzyme